MSSFSLFGGSDSRNSVGGCYRFDPTRVFFGRCLIRRRGNCGIGAMIRVFRLTCGKYKHFEFSQRIPLKPSARLAVRHYGSTFDGRPRSDHSLELKSLATSCSSLNLAMRTAPG